MTNNRNNDFFGLKITPVDLLASVFNEALANQSGTAKAKAREFDVKSHIDNFANIGQGIFESFNFPGVFDEKEGNVTGFTPAVDVLESETGVTYIVGAPGVRQEDVTVELEDAKLTIAILAGDVVISDQRTNNWKGGRWNQTFNVPTGDGDSTKRIDEENISATVENGLITVVVSYKAPKVTKIKVG